MDQRFKQSNTLHDILSKINLSSFLIIQKAKQLS